MFYESAYTRVPASLTLALIVTTGLLILMQALIASSGYDENDEPHVTIVDFVRVKEALPNLPPRRKAVEPPKPDTPPETPESSVATAGNGYSMEPQQFLQPAIETGIGYAPSDGVALPIVRVEPSYPRQALSRGIEGYTIVEFDAWTDGSVRNARIIENHPGSMFDQASLNAVQKFRFKPKIENGRPVIMTGLQNRFTFELDQARL